MEFFTWKLQIYIEFSSCNNSDCLKVQSLPFLQDLVFGECC